MTSRFVLALCLLLGVACGNEGKGSAAIPASHPPQAKPGAVDPSVDAQPVRAARTTDFVVVANRLAHDTIILDGHVDLPWRLWKAKADPKAKPEDVSRRTPTGDFDYDRAKAGGLDAPFMSIYVPAKYEMNGAKKVADELIDMVEAIAEKNPDKFAIATSPEQIRNNFVAGRISLAIGMENGAPIEGKLENVKYFYDRGVRYITLTHSKDNHISDSSFDDAKTHGGLSDFGRKVVGEMNRLGIMVDVSHISDEAFADVLEVSKVPVIASHSSCRQFTPGWQRNMSDDMIRALAKKEGVIQINFGSGFIEGDIQVQTAKNWDEIERILADKGLDFGDPKAAALVDAYWQENPRQYSTVEKVADHIEHVIKLVGIDHVGFGSDFDGVGDSLPAGLKDVSHYPNLIAELLERGYSPQDLEKICSGNVLRVWAAVQEYARKQAALPSDAGH